MWYTFLRKRERMNALMDFSGMFTTQGMMFLILMLGYLLS